MSTDQRVQQLEANQGLLLACIGGFLSMFVVARARELAMLAASTYELDKERWLREAYALVANAFPEPAKAFLIETTDASIGQMLRSLN